MHRYRLLTIGIVVLLAGIQFRLVDTFVLNEKASEIIQERLKKKQESSLTTQYTGQFDTYDSLWDETLLEPRTPSLQRFEPPAWLGWSLISVGGVLILTCPCYAKP